MAEVTYYYDAYLSLEWETDPQKMVDNILTNYAVTASDGDSEYLSSNTCPGNDLGTITKVELRVYGYGDGDDRIDLWPWSGFGASPTGTEHQLTMPSSAGWSAYVEITNDPEAPSPWTWPDIVSRICRVEFDKVAKGNTMRAGKVEIRITFTEIGAKTTQYLAGDDCPEFPHEMDLLSDKLPCPLPH